MKPQDRHHEDSKALQARAEERLLESALAEVLGAETAPDQSQEILRRHERRQAQPVTPEKREGRSTLSIHYLGNMAAALLISLAILFVLRPQPQLQAAELRIRVLHGIITFNSNLRDHEPTTHGPGWHVLLIRPGDRISTGDSDSSIALAQWGQVRLAPHSTLEFKKMETTTMNGKTIASSIVLGVVAGTATWFGIDGSTAIAADTSIEVGAEAGTAPTARFEKREQELLAENQRLKNKILELENEQGRTEVSVTKTEPPKQEEPVAMTIAPPMFTDAKYAEALAKVDWRVMGESMQKMLPLLSELMADWEENGQPSIELAGKIQALNGALLQQLPALQKGGIPGLDGNGVFTHPLVVSNQVGAFLTAAGIPLDERQIARLKALSSAYSTEDEVQRLSSAKDELSLAGVLAETGVKDRFYQDLRGLLTKDQIQKLYPDALKDRTSGDLFSTGLVWAQYAKRIRASGPAELQQRVSGSITRSLRLDSKQQKKLDGIVSQWAKEFPASMWKNKAGFYESNQRFKIQDVRRNAKRQMAFIRKISRELNLTPTQRERLLKSKAVFMPVSSR